MSSREVTIWAAIHDGIDIPKQHAIHQDPSGWLDVLWLRSPAVGLALPPAPRTWAPRREQVASLKGPYAEARDPVNLQ